MKMNKQSRVGVCWLCVCVVVLLGGCAAADESDPSGKTSKDTRSDSGVEDGNPSTSGTDPTDLDVIGLDDVSTSGGTSGVTSGTDTSGSTSGTSGTSGTTDSDTSGSTSGTSSGVDTNPPDTFVPTECVGSETQDLPCGMCGTQTNVCVGGFWTQGSCIQPPGSVCSPNQTRQQNCGADLGVCTAGTQAMRCNSTCMWEEDGVCSGVQPTDEICDYLDNDCDGLVDGDGCMVTVYEQVTGGYHEYSLAPFGTPRFRLYASDPGALNAASPTEALWVISKNGENRLVLTTQKNSHVGSGWATQNGGQPLGYCIPSQSDLPDPPNEMYTAPKSLMMHYKFISSGRYDNAYRLCVVGTGGACDAADVVAQGYTNGAPLPHTPTVARIPCFVFDP